MTCTGPSLMAELEAISGYPFNYPVYPPGNGNYIILSKGKYERRLHDSVLFRGKFLLERKEDCYPRKEKIFFTTDDTYSSGSYITIDAGRLALSSSNCLQDGGTAFYRKVVVVGATSP